MKRRGLVFITFGIILAIAVGILVFVTTQKAVATQVPMADVLVATQDIPERTVIQPGALAIKRVPVEAIPSGALVRPDEAVGRMSPQKIYAGEIILGAKLIDSKGQNNLSFTIPAGRVLITFPASNIVGLGLVKPGDTVDILATYNPAKSKSAQPSSSPSTLPPAVTLLTMQNLKVISIGGQTSVTSSSSQQALQGSQNPYITFAVEPQDALVLKAMKDTDDLMIELALRAAGDEEQRQTEPVTVKKALERYGVSPAQLGP